MSDIAIKVENLSKSYIVGHNTGEVERYTALRDVIARNARDLARKTRDMIQGRPIIQGDDLEEFWALKDIFFEVKQGERVGIIGRNGAGKSTLLKLLSRITEPTSGRITLNGRVASLLEVGTGFHPELTGRENIFLNGAILGMSRREIRGKFDEIVDFAEVERFLDTPVKRYSSGMYVRLAFSVAAYLETEILIVDEVLAVGDIAFQQKCLGKMEDVSTTGRTVLFVSHSLSAIERLCGRVLLFDQGRMVESGLPERVLRSYLQRSGRHFGQILPMGESSPAVFHNSNDGSVSITRAYTADAKGDAKTVFQLDESIILHFFLRLHQPLGNLHFYLRVYSEEGIQVFATGDWDELGMTVNSYRPGEYHLRLTIPSPLLNTGNYSVSLEGVVPEVRYIFKANNLLSWQSLPMGGVGGIASANRQGAVRPLLAWRVDSLEA